MNGMATRRTGPVTAGAAARPAPTPVRRIAALRAAGRTKGAHSAGRATAPRGATRPTTVCAFMNNPGLTIADAGVEPGVHDVHEEGHEDERRGDEQNQPLGQ